MLPTRPALRGLARHARRLTPLPQSGAIETPLASSSSSRSATQSRIGQYLVKRSVGGELPVYSDNTRGTVWKTIIRKVDGDVMSLRDELVTYMRDIHVDPLRPAPGVTVKPTSQNLVIKGRWVAEVKGFLESKGF